MLAHGAGVACLLWIALAGAAQADVLPFGAKIEKILDSTAEIAAIAQSPTGEIWLLERATGTLRVFNAGVEEATLAFPVLAACDSGLLDVAFAPDYASGRQAFVSYVDPGGSLRVDRVRRDKTSIAIEASVFSIGSTAGCRPGGGLAVGPDGKLYLGVGDLEDASAGQDDGTAAGKILRMELDGTVPPDNPNPASLIFAKGFRHPVDLDVDPDTARPHGTLYAVDAGDSVSAEDEINAAGAAGNHGWSVVSGDSSGVYDDPLASGPASGATALAALRLDGLGPGNEDSIVHTATVDDELRQLFLTGTELDTPDGSRTFFDPDDDRDGTPDTGCPAGLHALLEGADGMLYGAGASANPGIWRIWADRPGPREVSPDGSPFPLDVAKAGANLEISFENLGDLDAGRPARHGGQHAETYQIWEGTLPIAGTYNHVSVLTTDGTLVNGARRKATIVPGSGNRYYLVTAQGDNLEGPAGNDSTGAPRHAAEQDYCGNLGYGPFTGDCIDDFRHPLTGNPMKLVDYNPASPTYLQNLSVRDFRGRVVHLELAAANCFWCLLQGETMHDTDLAFRDRDFILLTVLTESEFGGTAFSDPAACAAAIASWATTYGEETPILCDVDFDGDGNGDVTQQFFHSAVDEEACGGFGQNIFVDQGGVVFAFDCSFTPGPEVSAIVTGEINPETCE